MAEVLEHRGDTHGRDGKDQPDSEELGAEDSSNFFTEWQLEPADAEPVPTD